MRTELTQNVVKCMSETDRRELGVLTADEVVEKITDKSEREIQDVFTAWLTQHGYWPRTNEFLDGRIPPRGWWFHIHEARKNPYLLDVAILNVKGGWYMEVELKTREGRVRPQQRAILGAGGPTCLCRSTKEAIEAVLEWEKSNDGT
jgi:hypothetical protein